MKIIQLNTWGGRLGKQIIELLLREEADIVCLQEAIEMPGGYSFLFEDLEEIKIHTNYQHCFFSPQFGYKIMKREARSGLAIMSNLPFLETYETFTRLQYINNFDLLDTDYNIRCLQHVKVAYKGQNINILNHHGHHIQEHKKGDEETQRQCKMIVDYIQKLQEPVVLCGDFNLTPDSKSIEQINNILINQVKKHDVLTTRTPLTHKSEVCDYIFTSPKIKVTNFQVLDDVVSDHKALLVEF